MAASLRGTDLSCLPVAVLGRVHGGGDVLVLELRQEYVQVVNILPYLITGRSVKHGRVFLVTCKK